MIGLTYLHSFLSASECASLIELGCGQFVRSIVGHGYESGYASSNRTSHSFPVYRHSDASRAAGISQLQRTLLARVAELTGVSAAHVEAMELVRYTPGQFFKPHCDSHAGSTEKARRWSVFTYLNDVPGGGGETHFTQIGVKFKPKQGDALWWENCPAPFKRGVYHESSKHEGCPPLSGVKYGE